MGALLLIGRPDDPCCQLVRDCWERDGHGALFVPEDRLFPHLRLAWQPSDDVLCGTIEYGDQRLAFADVDGVFCRSYGIPVTPEEFATRDGQYISAEWHALLVAWMWSLPCPVVNRLRPELWYRTYLTIPDLVALVPGLKLRLPRTLITTRVEDVRAFQRSMAGGVEYSPLTQPLRYVLGEAGDLDKLVGLSGILPFHLVEHVAGRERDVFVIGDATLSVGPDGTIDRPLPDAVAAHCVEAGVALGLCFCRLSLVGTEDGDWYCRGLDRMPQLFEYSPETREIITGRLAGLLGSRREATR